MEKEPRSSFRQIRPAPKLSEGPARIRVPLADMSERADAQVGMLILIGGGTLSLILGLWTFMVSDADGNITFLWLSLGSLVAVAASLGLVEVQHRRQGALSILHDYLLGFGLLFAFLGTFWATRYGLYVVCGGGLAGLCQGVAVDDGTWMPGPWGIVVQAAAFLAVAWVLWQLTVRVQGGTLPRTVMVLGPLAVVLIGAEIWVDWSAGAQNLPLLLGVFSLTTLSMALSTLSNRSPLFITSAVLCSLIPFLYEGLDGHGAGLSMLVVIVLVQGVFAAHPGLSRTMVEKGSVALVLLVVLAQWLGGALDAEFFLLVPLSGGWASLNLALWLALLVGYFWPVHHNRVPSMPIGLGFALLLVPSPGAMLAWCLGLLAFIYMLTKPQTRRWVANWTFVAMMFAWWFGGWIGQEITELRLDPIFLAVPPLALAVAGHFAVREKVLSSWAHNLGLLLVLLSHELLMGSGAWLPLGLAAFLLLLVWQQSQDAARILAAGEGARMEATGRMAMAVIGILILEMAGRLDLPMVDVGGIHVTAMFIAVALYAIGRRLTEVEVDLGLLIGRLGRLTTTVPEWDAETQIWVQRETEVSSRLASLELGPAARLGLWGPLALFAIALSKSGNPLIDLHLVALLLLPIGILVREILVDLPHDDRSRAAGAWILFMIGAPTAWVLHHSPADILTPSALLFDAMLLAGPSAAELVLRRRGLSGEKDMAGGSATLLGLLAIALLDSSGGLLALGLFTLVLQRGFMHRQGLAISLLGFAWMVWIWTLHLGSAGMLISKLPEVAYLAEMPLLGLPRWAGLGLLIIGLPSGIAHMLDLRREARGEVVDAHSHPIAAPAVHVLIGAFLLVPDAHWFAVAAVLALSVGAWTSGRLSWFYASGPVLFIALMYAGGKEWDLSFSDAIRFSGAGTFLHSAAFYILHRQGRLFRDEVDEWPGARRTHLVDSLVLTGFISAMLADDHLYGLSLVLGAVLMTGHAHARRWSDFLVLLPVAHAWVVARVLADWVPDAAAEIAGVVLLVESMLLTWSSWTYYDYGWTELSDGEVVERAERSGWAGALLFLPAAWLLAVDLELWFFGGMLCVHAAGQMALGFQRDVGWRRVYAILGVLIGFFIIGVDIESGILRGVMLVLASLTMLMMGFLYMGRAGIEMAGTGAVEAISVEASTTVMEGIPDPVLEEDEPEEDEAPEPGPLPEPAPPAPTRIATEFYDIELPNDIRVNIETAVRNTPHEGFRAVVRWDAWGQVVLDWEPEA